MLCKIGPKCINQASLHDMSRNLLLVNVLYINPFPNKPLFSRVCSTSLSKTLREKEKLLVTRNFSFSYSVFYPFWRTFSAIFIKFQIIVCKLFQFGRDYKWLFGKGLKDRSSSWFNLSFDKLDFMDP